MPIPHELNEVHRFRCRVDPRGRGSDPSIESLATSLSSHCSFFRLGLLACAVSALGCKHHEQCDWVDNDHDGIIDEGFDADGDGRWACGLSEVLYELGEFDCDDSAPDVHPDAPEVCDGLDNDCNGATDEGCSQPIIALPSSIAELKVGRRTSGLPFVVALAGQWRGQSVALLEMDRGGRLVSSPAHDIGYAGLLTILPIEASDTNDAWSALSDGLLYLPADEDSGFQVDLENESEVWWSQSGDPLIDRPVSLLGVGDLGERPTSLLVTTAWPYNDPGGLIETRWVSADRDASTIARLPWPLSSYKLSGVERADLDGDQREDLIVASGNRIVWRSDYVSPTSEPSLIVEADAEIGDFEVGDVDGDGDLDLVLTLPERWRIYVLRNLGGAVFGSLETIQQSLRHPTFLALRDLDAQPGVELVAADPGEPTLSVLASDVDGMFTERCLEPTAGGVTALVAVDRPEGGAGVLTGHADGSVRWILDPCSQR